MCSVCGCDQAKILAIHPKDHFTGDHSHGHSHVHQHGHAHHHPHEHEPHHSAQPLPSPTAAHTVIIHHHHYYYQQGDVHHHYHAPLSAAHAHPEPPHAHEHSHEQHHHTPLRGEHQLDYGQGQAGLSVPGMGQRQLIAIEMDVLSKNNQLAAHNREHFAAAHQLVLNLVSSPGSGKTTLLCQTLLHLQASRVCAVIEGDQQTSADADRIRATGVPAIQINTGKGCHLDAQMVHDACHQLNLPDHGVLFIENVGNLVCPASFDLGEKYKVAILSVTEGEEKPLKYPDMFAAARLMIINKIDLLAHVNFDLERCIANAKKVNPYIEVIALSATTGEGMDQWLAWLAKA